MRYVTTSTFHLKTKRCELEHGKAKAVKRGHNIEDPAGYPVPLKCAEEIDWNISIQSYDKAEGFSLNFNDINFKNLPYQSEIVARGP